MCSGRFSRRLLTGIPKKTANLSIATWNARALLHTKPKKRADGVAYLNSLLLQLHVLLVQEVHSTHADFLLAVGDLANTFWIQFSPGPNLATPGIATFIRKTDSESFVDIHSIPVQPGRILVTNVSLGERRCTSINLHNFGFNQSQKLAVVVRIQPFVSFAIP